MLYGGVDVSGLFHRVMGAGRGRRRIVPWPAPRPASSAAASSDPDEVRAPRSCAPTALRGVPPEQRLMLAVLEDALTILTAGPRRTTSGRLFWDTRSWILDDDHAWPFSFLNVCDALDIDPIRLRRRLAAHGAAMVVGRPEVTR
ncbi:MAG: hypothetical protein KIT14_22710 [bacterium]|nr:hypothetical protein [bacterium]